MNSKNSYKILPDLKLILELFSTETSINDALELKKNEINNKDYNSSFNFIVVLHGSNSPVRLEAENEIKIFIDSIKTNQEILGNRRSAILTHTPNQMVLGTFYESAAKDLPMNFEIFSTIQSAIHWIGLSSKDEPVIAKHIELLKNSSI
jgi:hypothetical protein